MPNTSTDDAVMPDAALAVGTPPRTSIEYCMAPAAATPPGTIRPNAFDASWEVAIGLRWSALTAIFCTIHMQA